MFLPGHSADHHYIWSVYLGCDPVHRMTTGKFPPQGGTVDIRETSAIIVWWDLVIHPAGGGYLGYGPG